MRVVKTLTYTVWDKERERYDSDVHVDQDGKFFTVTNGWYCEGGGGYDDEIDQDRYEVHLDS